MTLQQLLNEVYCLGFEDEGELNDSFIFSANRALRSIALEFAKENKSHIVIPEKKISYYLESYTHTPNKELRIELMGSAFSFKYSGKGSYKLIDGLGEREKEFSGKTGEIRSSIKFNGTIIFFGDCAFNVSDFTVFSSLPSAATSDIPIMHEIMEYDLSEYISDIMIITRAPTDKMGAVIKGATIESNILRLPKEFFGEVCIYYKKMPYEISINDFYKKVDIPDFCKHLLPILTASYVWLDDDIEKSDYYMKIYKDEVGKMKFSLRNSHGGAYGDVTGWA